MASTSNTPSTAPSTSVSALSSYISAMETPVLTSTGQTSPISKTKKRAAPSLASPLSTMVTILVGEQKAKFVIHQEFLTFHSEYFRGCLESGFIETATKVVELEHTTPEAFGLFVQWIYTKNISQKSSSDPPKSDDSILAAKDLVELWILSDYLAIPELQNKTIAMLLRAWSMRGVPIRYCINVYQSTAVGSPLRQLVVDLFAWTIRPGYFYMFKKYQNEFPHEMLFDIVEAFYKKPSLSESPVKDPSNYYVKVVTE